MTAKSADPAYPSLEATPPCYGSNADWRRWNSNLRLAQPSPHGICADCTPAHQAAMADAGRCGWAGRVTFHHDRDGGVTGWRVLHLVTK